MCSCSPSKGNQIAETPSGVERNRPTAPDDGRAKEDIKMKTADFNRFARIVAEADKNSYIWWQGYYWLDLTAKQATKIDAVLRTKGFLTSVYDSNGREWHKLPSGIEIVCDR